MEGLTKRDGETDSDEGREGTGSGTGQDGLT